MVRLAMILSSLALATAAAASGRVVLPPVASTLGSVPSAGASAAAIAGAIGPQLSLGLALPSPKPRVRIGAAVAPAQVQLPRMNVAGLSALAHAKDPGRWFDGARRPDVVQLVLPFPDLESPRQSAPKDGALPPYLSIADPAHAKWLADVTAAAWKSKAARRVLAQADELSRGRGRPITVFVSELRANNGEYVYDWDMVQMAKHYLKKDPVEAAPTFVHELLHVVQKAQLLPTDALEMELEAYLVTFEVMRELGLPFEKNSFYRNAYNKFRGGTVPEFVKWLTESYETNIPLAGSRLSAYVKELEKRREKTKRRIVRWERKIKASVDAIAEMERTGQDARAIEVYRVDALAKLELQRRDEKANLQWIERDLAMLATEAGRERYRAYSRRVLDYARRLHARYNSAQNGV
ncbi:MAG: hypothetical protein HY553_04105 [Elusimicrobia bacterium]|nr:hypothetical protein [Elusimicrobiota bacterium]